MSGEPLTLCKFSRETLNTKDDKYCEAQLDKSNKDLYLIHYITSE